jgi:hypothetical protein
MAYTQSPANVLKGQMKNKAAGLMHGDSVAHQNVKKGNDSELLNYSTNQYSYTNNPNDRLANNRVQDGHLTGARFHYSDKEDGPSVREAFNQAFKRAGKLGAKTFNFHHSGTKDKDGKYTFKGGKYTTEKS